MLLEEDSLRFRKAVLDLLDGIVRCLKVDIVVGYLERKLQLLKSKKAIRRFDKQNDKSMENTVINWFVENYIENKDQIISLLRNAEIHFPYMIDEIYAGCCELRLKSIEKDSLEDHLRKLGCLSLIGVRAVAAGKMLREGIICAEEYQCSDCKQLECNRNVSVIHIALNRAYLRTKGSIDNVVSLMCLASKRANEDFEQTK
jgi:hypothetical protein